MNTPVIDTLAYAKRLKAAGVPDAQAEAQAEALAEALVNNLATKHDLNEAVHRLESRMTIFDGRINVVQWVTGFNLAFTVTLIFKLFS